MNVSRTFAAILSTEPPEKEPVLWVPWFTIVGGLISSFGSGYPVLHWLGFSIFLTGCILTLRYISFNGLGWILQKRST